MTVLEYIAERQKEYSKLGAEQKFPYYVWECFASFCRSMMDRNNGEACYKECPCRGNDGDDEIGSCVCRWLALDIDYVLNVCKKNEVNND